jgi:hypothetical protein
MVLAFSSMCDANSSQHLWDGGRNKGVIIQIWRFSALVNATAHFSLGCQLYVFVFEYAVCGHCAALMKAHGIGRDMFPHGRGFGLLCMQSRNL